MRSQSSSSDSFVDASTRRSKRCRNARSRRLSRSRELRRQRLLDAGEDRPLARGATDEHERVVGRADERRREHGQQRLVVVAVVQEPEVREQVDDLLLAEVAPPRRAIRPQPRPAQLLLVPLRVGAGGEEQDDLARLGVAVVDELLDALRDVLRLRAPPVDVRARVRRLVGDEQLDGRAEHGVGELARRVERLELVAELAGEELVHDREHLRPRAVVLGQRQNLRRRRPALAEDLHVRVAEPVDRLELVADEEDVGVRAHQVDQLALQAVRVLELVDHDRREAELLPRAHVVVRLEEIARAKLQVLEVEHRLAVLRRLVLRREAGQEILEELAVARGDVVERRLLDRGQRLRVRRARARRAPSGR